VDLGGKNVKDATGYHLMELMMGSEGTLGVITRVTLKLLPLPSRAVSLLIPFPDLGSAARAVSETLRRRIVPVLAEFMDDVSIRAAADFLGRDLPAADRAGAYVFIGLDGESADDLTAQMERVAEIAMENGALDVLAAEDRGQQDRLWQSRRVLGDAMKKMSSEVGKADVVVPRGCVAELVAEVKRVGAECDVTIACFGHAGDGNVHVNVLRCGLDAQRWGQCLPRAMEGIMDAVRRLEGRPSGEHGIGALKRREAARFLGPRVTSLARAVKDAFDPAGILNPGKVL
jgi:glycolate oxidase